MWRVVRVSCSLGIPADTRTTACYAAEEKLAGIPVPVFTKFAALFGRSWPPLGTRLMFCGKNGKGRGCFCGAAVEFRPSAHFVLDY